MQFPPDIKPNNEKVLYLVRGLPGSGKSFLSSALSYALNSYHKDSTYYISADDYFTTSDGEYKFDFEKLEEAHAVCKTRCELSMKDPNTVCVIVHNTFTKREYMHPYIMLAHQYGYKVIEIKMSSPFESTHGVPDDILRKMYDELNMKYNDIHSYQFQEPKDLELKDSIYYNAMNISYFRNILFIECALTKYEDAWGDPVYIPSLLKATFDTPEEAYDEFIRITDDDMKERATKK